MQQRCPHCGRRNHIITRYVDYTSGDPMVWHCQKCGRLLELKTTTGKQLKVVGQEDIVQGPE